MFLYVLYFALLFIMIASMWISYFKRIKSQKRMVADSSSATVSVVGTIESVGPRRKTGAGDAFPYVYYWMAEVRYTYGGQEYTATVRIYVDREYHSLGKKKPEPGREIGILLDPDEPEVAIADQAAYNATGRLFFESSVTPFILVVASIFILYEAFHTMLKLF